LGNDANYSVQASKSGNATDGGFAGEGFVNATLLGAKQSVVDAASVLRNATDRIIANLSSVSQENSPRAMETAAQEAMQAF